VVGFFFACSRRGDFVGVDDEIPFCFMNWKDGDHLAEEGAWVGGLGRQIS
jgi:hypothetical protein